MNFSGTKEINDIIQSFLADFNDFYTETFNKAGKSYMSEAVEMSEILQHNIPVGDTAILASVLFRSYNSQLIDNQGIKQYVPTDIYPNVLNILEGLKTVNKLDNEKVFSLTENQFREKIKQKSKRSKKFASDYDSYMSEQGEYFKHFYISMGGDIRVVLIKLAHNFYKIKNIKSFDEQRRLIICREARYLYAPMAHQLMLYNVKTLLEETAMKYLNSDVYHYIAEVLNQTKKSREEYIENFIKPIRKSLQDIGIQAIIKGRPKSIHSIWNKMKVQGVGIDKIYDLFAIRIIITNKFKNLAEEKGACWQVYSKITDHWRPNPDRLKDWISAPKASGYESLHTTVIGPQGKWVEVQIRTKRMDDNAERGTAAHWKYKNIKEKVVTGNKGKSWLEELQKILENPQHETNTNTQKDLYSDILFVYTPKGELKKLDGGSTVLDFAYKIHTDVGNHCTGAKINGKIVGIRHKITNGDVIEILTSPKQYPKEEWLDIVVSNHAKARIKRSLNNLRIEKINKGKEILIEIYDKFAQKYKFDETLDQKKLTRLLKHFDIDRQSDLYSAIADEKISITVEDLYNLFIAPEEKSYKKLVEQLKSQVVEVATGLKNKDLLIIDKNMTGIKYEFAKCCNPIPGDDVFAFVTATRGTKIHKIDCPNAKDLFVKYPYRIMRAAWKSDIANEKFKTKIKIISEQKPGIVASISSIIAKQPYVELYDISINETPNQTYEGTIGIYANGKKSVDDFINKLKNIKGILNVTRINEV